MGGLAWREVGVCESLFFGLDVRGVCGRFVESLEF